jgi:DNA adenine methylase
MEAKQDFYYQIRSEFNDVGFETDLTIEDAVRFIFLNKTNYNGLFRVNAAGDYNAAFGWKESIKTNDEANLSNCSVALQNVEIMNGDFENACKGLAAGDFVYFDPPYHSTFDGYQSGGFSEDDHLRLHSLFRHLSENGVYCMLSYSNTDFVKSLYGGYYVEVVSAKRMVNRDGNGRTGEELIITNYLE